MRLERLEGKKLFWLLLAAALVLLAAVLPAAQSRVRPAIAANGIFVCD
jgi:hypothetical protein